MLQLQQWDLKTFLAKRKVEKLEDYAPPLFAIEKWEGSAKITDEVFSMFKEESLAALLNSICDNKNTLHRSERPGGNIQSLDFDEGNFDLLMEQNRVTTT